jgi:hypothetical protein
MDVANYESGHRLEFKLLGPFVQMSDGLANCMELLSFMLEKRESE